ncbi:MAG: DUF5317 domain-containing protein [Chloroflexi bacterium]|nr:DUF5317 domain-containing protein [Chloroflexota bacterium]
MILLLSVVSGSLAGLGVARSKGHVWHPPVFSSVWLVFLGFLPQWLAFYLPSTRRLLTDSQASACLVVSQILLLGFALANLRLSGMIFLTFGLGCNLAVILANGGFMPLTVEAATSLVSQTTMNSLSIGERISSASKDILLSGSQIFLPWLADRFVPPHFMPYRFAFSLGDIFISVGAFWMLLNGSSSISVLNSGET